MMLVASARDHLNGLENGLHHTCAKTNWTASGCRGENCKKRLIDGQTSEDGIVNIALCVRHWGQGQTLL